MIENDIHDIKKLNNHLLVASKIAKIGFWEFDAKTLNISWSESIYDIFEIEDKNKQITYETFLNFLPNDDKINLQNEFSNSIEEKREYITTHKIITEKNNIKYVEERAKHFYDKNGNHLKSIGSIYDITEKHLINARYKTILNLASDGIHILDLDGNIIEVSESFLNMLGYKEEEIKNLNIKDIDSKMKKEDINNIIKKLVNQPETFITQHKRKNGTIIDVQINAKSIELDSHTFIYASSRDISKEIEYQNRITEQKNALELEKSKLHTIIHNIPDPLWIKDVDGKFLTCNKRFEDLYGAKENEIIGKTDFEFVDKKLALFFRKHDKNAMNSDIPLSNEEELVFASDGHKELLNTTKVKVSDKNNKLLGVLGIARDITQIKKIQNELEKEKTKYKTFMENSSDAIFIINLDGFVIEYNNLFKTLLGYENNELKNLHVSDFEAIHSKELIKENIENAKFRPIYFDSKYKRKDGTLFDVSISIIKIEIDKKTYIYSSFRDISEQKKLQNNILEQKEEFETIFNYSHDPIAIIDLKAKILKFNNSFIDLTEYTKDELFKMNYSDLTIKSDLEIKTNAIKDAIKNRHIENIEKRCITKTGKEITINMSISLLPDKKRLLLSLKDISSLKIMEQQSRLASMGEMIGNIAHQWRQPLSMITTLISGLKLKSEFYEVSKDDINECERGIIKQAKYLSDTIDNFRNFIKGEKVIHEISLVEIVKNSLSLLNASLHNNYINLILNLDDDIKLFVNKNELSEAFINIINNSKDALKNNVKNEEDRLLFISTKLIDKKTIQLKFLDTGGGIDEKNLDRIFEPYFTTKHQSQGTGLGLAMVDKIIRERHNGKIKVKNETFEYKNKIYKGACFIILFEIQ